MADFKFHKELRLNEEQYNAIGILAVEWSHTEDVLIYILAQILDSDEDTIKILSSRTQSRTLIEICKQCVYFKHPDIAPSLDKYFKRLDKAREYRNQVLHTAFNLDLRRDKSTQSLKGTYGWTKINKQQKTIVFGNEISLTTHQIKRRALYISKVLMESLTVYSLFYEKRMHG